MQSDPSMVIRANVVNITQRSVQPSEIYVSGGKITHIRHLNTPCDTYVLPGFVDAHVHVESAMLIPSEFARLAVLHGTVATVSDPHEIGNVLGVEGVRFMVENGQQVPFKFYFGVPSCVPATSFETAGATIDANDVELLFNELRLKYLAEMMNYPGVLHNDPLVMKKLEIAQKYGKKIDGHAPGLRGQEAARYIAAGISTDHECFSREEALEKLQYGMKILIREGSAAKNFEALADLLHEHYPNMMFCSDDKHPDSLVVGHINELVRRAVNKKGIDLFKVLQAACVNPVLHYGLEVGLLREGDPADFIVVDNLRDFNVLQTYINGQLVAERGRSLIQRVPCQVVNRFNTSPKAPAEFAVKASRPQARVIECLDGELITNSLLLNIKQVDGWAVSDTENDILKMVVVNRYEETEPAIAFIHNVGLKRGAIASSVGHDSHNIIAVGVDDESLCRAVNLIIAAKGGVSAVDGTDEVLLPLPVAGIMSAEDCYQVAQQYSAIDQKAKQMGSTLQAPYMSLSFMALLVIPSLKLSDKGLFDGDTFRFTELFPAQTQKVQK